MPIITMNLQQRKVSVEQKQRITEEITDILTKTLDCPKEAVCIIINEQLKEN
ncbi:MAG: tautomerase family protein [bacterium]|nr:tautomerase family protein [bacterium]